MNLASVDRTGPAPFAKVTRQIHRPRDFRQLIAGTAAAVVLHREWFGGAFARATR